MKKIITLFILLSSILGCSNKQNIQYDIQSFDLTKLSQISDIEYEILRVTHNKIILNELNTFNDPFLFTTKSYFIFFVSTITLCAPFIQSCSCLMAFKY